jgi:DNA-binding transcriptional LysR family regulator
MAVAPDHRLAKIGAISVRALEGEFMVERRDCLMAARLRAACDRMGVTLRTRHLVDTDEHLQHLAATSLGIALLPERSPLVAPLVTRHIVDADLTRSRILAVISARRFPLLSIYFSESSRGSLRSRRA